MMLSRNRALYLSLILIMIIEVCFGYYYRLDEFQKKGGHRIHPNVSGMAYVFPPNSTYKFSDEAAYNKLAYSILVHGGYYNPLGEQSAWVTPGLPIVLAITYYFFGYSFIPVLFLNAIFLALEYFFFFRVADKIFGRKVAIVTLFLYAINIRIAYHLGSVETEPFFILLLSVATFVFFQSREKQDSNSSGGFVILGLALGFGFLVRPIILLFSFVIMVSFFCSRIDLKKVLIVVLLGFGIPLSWICRNYFIFEGIVVSTNSSYAIYLVDYDKYKNITLSSHYFLRYKSIERDVLTEARKVSGNDSLYFEKAYHVFDREYSKWRKENFGLFLKISAWRLKSVLFPYTADMSNRNRVLSSALWFITIFPAIVFLFFHRDRNTILIFLMGMSLVLIPVFTILDSYLRYQIPLQLYTTMLSASSILYLSERVKSWVRKRKGGLPEQY